MSRLPASGRRGVAGRPPARVVRGVVGHDALRLDVRAAPAAGLLLPREVSRDPVVRDAELRQGGGRRARLRQDGQQVVLGPEPVLSQPVCLLKGSVLHGGRQGTSGGPPRIQGARQEKKCAHA